MIFLLWAASLIGFLSLGVLCIREASDGSAAKDYFEWADRQTRSRRLAMASVVCGILTLVLAVVMVHGW